MGTNSSCAADGCDDCHLKRVEGLETLGSSPRDYASLLFTAGCSDRRPKQQLFAGKLVRPDSVPLRSGCCGEQSLDGPEC